MNRAPLTLRKPKPVTTADLDAFVDSGGRADSPLTMVSRDPEPSPDVGEPTIETVPEPVVAAVAVGPGAEVEPPASDEQLKDISELEVPGLTRDAPAPEATTGQGRARRRKARGSHAVTATTPPVHEPINFRRATRAIAERVTKPARRRTTVYLSLEVAQKLADHCARADVEMSAAINEALDEFLR